MLCVVLSGLGAVTVADSTSPGWILFDSQHGTILRINQEGTVGTDWNCPTTPRDGRLADLRAVTDVLGIYWVPAYSDQQFPILLRWQNQWTFLAIEQLEDGSYGASAITSCSNGQTSRIWTRVTVDDDGDNLYMSLWGLFQIIGDLGLPIINVNTNLWMMIPPSSTATPTPPTK